MTDNNTDNRSEQNRRQIILPHVDTSPSVHGKTLREWLAYLPAGIGLFGAFMALLLDAMVLAGALAAITAFGLVFVGVHLESEISEAWYLTPRGIVKDYFSYRRFKRELPWGTNAEQRADLHNVRCIHPDGSYKRHDRSRVALLRIDGTNMDRLSTQMKNNRVQQHTDGIDEELGPADQWWGFYSTTRPATSDPHALQREQRAAEFQSDLSSEHREIIEKTGAWLRENDATVDANEWRHYAVVEVHPSDPAVALPNQSVSARVQGYVGRVTAIVPSITDKLPIDNSDEEEANAPLDDNKRDAITSSDNETRAINPSENDEGDVNAPSDETDFTENDPTTGAPIGEVLAHRVTLVSRALERVEGVTVERASPAEHINLLRSYWTNQGSAIGQAPDGSPAFGGTDSLLQRAFQRELSPDGTTPTEQLLATGTFDVDGDTVELAGTYVRTFWIADWPIRPCAMFLDDLYTYGGIDLDVRVHAIPINRYTAADIIEEIGLDVGAETISRASSSDFGALSIGGAKEVYEDAYSQLTNSNVDAWNLNAYVTVRATDPEALDDACESLVRRLQANPAGCSPVASGTNQRAALTSASPAGHDAYAEVATGNRRHLALSGALGALFPFSSTDLSESDGIFWGRDTRTGESIVADLFSRGHAPHIMTIGETRSGKTTFVRDRTGDWYLGGEDRTLIVADMESGFGGLTEVCGGQHIIVDGNDPVNPWHIEPVSAARRRETNNKLAPLAAQIDFVTELTMNVVRVGLPAGVIAVDPELYRIARYAVGLTYDRAGITTDLDTHTRTSPTYHDFFDMLSDIRDNPSGHTIRGTDGERAAREKQAEKLLESLLELTDAGRYAHLRGTGTTSLLDDDVSMAYLDMPQLQGSSDAAKSIGLQIALHQIAQKIKRTPGRTIFCIDEAHVLYQSDEMVDWLAGAARRWARYDAAMWSISQSPEEFVQQKEEAAMDSENKRQAIFEQTSTMQAFYAGNSDAETLKKFGLESGQQIHAVQNTLTTGKSAGYSECLVSFDDQEGWLECTVNTSPVTSAIDAITNDEGTTDQQAEEHNGLTTIETLNATAADQLAAGGIKTSEDLLSTDAREVAALTSASGKRIDDWYNAALGRNGTANRNVDTHGND